MANFTKTFKSEYHYGGKVTVQIQGTLVLASFGEDELTHRDSLKDGGWKGRLRQFLELNTSSFWAELITEYTIEKSKK